jgi:hypothetical protein
VSEVDGLLSFVAIAFGIGKRPGREWSPAIDNPCPAKV